MREIQLTKGKVALVDDEDYEWLTTKTWCVATHRNYAARGARKPDGSWTLVYMHREILRAGVDVQVDHINGNTLDNRKINLRICSRTENLRNQKGKKRHMYKGITPRRGGWMAQIQVDGRHIRIGDFKTPELAAAAYDEKALFYFGEFARLNFPREETPHDNKYR